MSTYDFFLSTFYPFYLLWNQSLLWCIRPCPYLNSMYQKMQKTGWKTKKPKEFVCKKSLINQCFCYISCIMFLFLHYFELFVIDQFLNFIHLKAPKNESHKKITTLIDFDFNFILYVLYSCMVIYKYVARKWFQFQYFYDTPNIFKGWQPLCIWNLTV